MVFKQTFGNHIKAARYVLLLIFGLLGVGYYLQLDSSVTIYVYFISAALLLSCLPLHIAYYKKDKNKVVTVSDGWITITNDNLDIHRPLSDISSIKIIGSKNIEDFGIKQLPSESYFYLVLSFNDKKYVVCTCLIFPDYNTIETTFKGVWITREYNLINDLPKRIS